MFLLLRVVDFVPASRWVFLVKLKDVLLPYSCYVEECEFESFVVGDVEDGLEYTYPRPLHTDVRVVTASDLVNIVKLEQA